MYLRMLFSLITLPIILLFYTKPILASPEIKSIRTNYTKNYTRLVFDSEEKLHYSIFYLSLPSRLVIDVNGFAKNSILDPLNYSRIRFIKHVRWLQKSPNKFRIVLDLTRPIRFKSFLLGGAGGYKHRLVIDLYQKVNKKATDSLKTRITERASLEQLRGTFIKDKDKKKSIIVVIDPGHGGEDPGAISSNGLEEKDVVLEIAKKLYHKINSIEGFNAIMTRTGDYFIPLRERTEIARSKGADLFISIHADAAPSKIASGASVFALSERGASSETARWIAESENRSDLIGLKENVSLHDKDKVLATVLLDLSMNASLTSSLDIGNKVLMEISKINLLHKPYVEQAGFLVLKSPDIPSILVETGFISNKTEATKLSSRSHQEKLAKAITTAIKNFFQKPLRW